MHGEWCVYVRLVCERHRVTYPEVAHAVGDLGAGLRVLEAVDLLADVVDDREEEEAPRAVGQSAKGGDDHAQISRPQVVKPPKRLIPHGFEEFEPWVHLPARQAGHGMRDPVRVERGQVGSQASGQSPDQTGSRTVPHFRQGAEDVCQDVARAVVHDLQRAAGQGVEQMARPVVTLACFNAREAIDQPGELHRPVLACIERHSLHQLLRQIHVRTHAQPAGQSEAEKRSEKEVRGEVPMATQGYSIQTTCGITAEEV